MPAIPAALASNHALDEELAEESGAAGAQSGPDGEFAAPGQSAGEQQAGDVGAPDKQQHGHGGGENPQLGAQVPDDEIAQRQSHQFAGCVRVRRGGILRAVLAIEDTQLRIDGGQRSPGRQSRDVGEVACTHPQALRRH